MDIERLIYLVSFLGGGMGALFVVFYGSKLGLLDRPNHRSSHSQTTPKGGGIGLVFAFLLSSILLKMPLYFFLPIVLLAVLSLWGDRVEISPRLRLLAQFLLIAILIIAHRRGELEKPLTWGLCVLQIVFIVGTGNFFNFMDGINGIAGVTGVIGFGFLTISLQGAQPLLSTLSFAISLACFAFLPFNFPRARVFMGDVGSMTLGVVFAFFVVIGSEHPLDFFVRASFIFPFFADEFSTMWLRFRRGEELTQAHRLHIYQLLANEWGFPHWRVSLGYGVFQIVVGISVAGVGKLGLMAVLLALVFWFIVFIKAGNIIRKKKVS